MADYDVTQLTDGSWYDDFYFPLNLRPTISNDGRRVVHPSRIVPERPGYAIWLYDRDGDAEPRQISVDARGAIRLVVRDQVPRHPSGAAQRGEPGLRKYVCSNPSISRDGRWLAYVWTDYEHCGATRDHWMRTRERLMLADVGGATVRGGTVLEVLRDNAFGNGIHSLRMSGDGRHIAFYAGGVMRGLQVSNLEMPPYEARPHVEWAGPTCDVHCFLVTVRSPGSYSLRAVPDPDASTRPLVVAHPETSSVQSFRVSSVLGHPPSICDDGSRVALHAGFAMGADNTGVYVYEPIGGSPGTRPVLTFGAVPGAAAEDEALTTGAAPALSADGHWLAHYRREVTFPPGYGDPAHYEEGETYCPCVNKDEVVVAQIPSGESSELIESADDTAFAVQTPTLGLALAEEATHLAFLSRADKVGRNRDLSHEVYYAALAD